MVPLIGFGFWNLQTNQHLTTIETEDRYWFLIVVSFVRRFSAHEQAAIDFDLAQC